MDVTLLRGHARDALATLDAGSVHTCVTSPPYFGLRSYGGGAHEIGTEQTPAAYVAALVDVFRGVWRVLREDGTLWLVLGDSYAGSWGNQGRKPAGERASQRPINGPILQQVHDGRYPAREHNIGACPPGVRPKSLLGIPWRVAFALQDDGWICRQELIWHKPNPMPESVKDRCTRGHETVFMLAKSPRYFYDADAIREPHAYGMNGGKFSTRYRHAQLQAQNGSLNVERTMNPAGRNRRSVWTVATSALSSKKFGCSTEHYAAFPPELLRPMVRAATSERGVCAQCGAPYQRQTVQIGERWVRRSATKALAQEVGGTHRERTMMRVMDTVGWAPTCSCDAGEPVPATVLDCFCGSGTTGVVAVQEGRRFVGIDLNAAYLDLARARLAQTQPPLISAG